MKQSLKILVLSAVLVTVGFAQQAKAQVDVSINPVPLLWNNISGSADFVLQENFSIEGQLGVSFGDQLGLKYFAVPITASGKYYFNPEKGADKFYANAFLRFVSRNYSDDDGSASGGDVTWTRLGLGFGLGYKVVSEKGIVFDVGIGAGRAFVDNINYEDENDSENLDLEWFNIMVVGRLSVGYRFGGK